MFKKILVCLLIIFTTISLSNVSISMNEDSNNKIIEDNNTNNVFIDNFSYICSSINESISFNKLFS